MAAGEVVVNRQTLAVALGTLAVVLIGGFLMYASPAPEGARPPPRPASAAKVEKGKRVGESSHRHLNESKLVHEVAVPADRPAAPKDAPNVVVVFASTQRRDQWSAYGGPPTTTPYLAQQAAAGVKFTDALSVSVEPRTAAGALITGRYPHRVGLVEPGEQKNFRDLSPDAVTLAERLQAAGWFTVGGTANHNLNERAGAAQGFDWYRDSQPFSLMLEQRMDADEVVAKALERVARRSDAEKARPLYLQLAFVDSHKPFKVPPEASKPFENADDPCDCAPYRATIKRMDDAVKQLVEGLAAQGLSPENTIFTVVADHGEGLDLPPAHRKQHGFVLYRSSVQIPWLVWGKGVPAGKEAPGLASQLDVAPTLAALAGLKDQQGMDGVDLSAVVTAGAPSPRTEAYADTLYQGAHRASVWTTDRQCQKDYGSELEEPDTFATGCFDRKADPDFTTVIADEALAARLEELHTELMAGVGGAPAEAKSGKGAKGAKAKGDKAGKAKGGKAKGEGKAKAGDEG